MIRELQPGACVFSDAGPDICWIGNERGEAGEPCWATMNKEGLHPGKEGIEKRLNAGERGADTWLPGECDVSIRPGWFFHESENGKVRTPENLLELYLKSVGRGASFLLNVPPDRRGRWHESDIAALRGFAKLRDSLFETELSQRANGPKALLDGRASTFWSAGGREASVELRFQAPGPVGIVRFREFLPGGQRIESWKLELSSGGGWRELGAGQSVGSCRLVRSGGVVADAVRLTVRGAAEPLLSELRVYRGADPA